MLTSWRWSQGRRESEAAARTAELLAGAEPRDGDETTRVRLVRDLHPSLVVPEHDRVFERSMLLRAAEIAERGDEPRPVAEQGTSDETSLHTTRVVLGGYDVVLVDVESFDEGRVKAASRTVSDAIVEQLGIQTRPRTGQDG